MQLYKNPPQRQQAPREIPDDVPCYRLEGAKYWLGTRMIEEGSYIFLAPDQEPNEFMWPMNDLALANVRAFLKKLDNASFEAEEANKKYSDRKFPVAPKKLPAFESRYAAATSRKGNKMEPDAPIFSNKIASRIIGGVLDQDDYSEVAVAETAGREAVNNATGADNLGAKQEKLGLKKTA